MKNIRTVNKLPYFLLAAACAITLLCSACAEQMPLEAVTVLNALAPSGETDEVARSQRVFVSAKTAAQLDAWNTASELSDEKNKVLGAYRAAKGASEGTVIVKTVTKGFGDTGFVLYTAIAPNGKITAMYADPATAAGQTYYKAEDIAAINTAVKDKTAAALTTDTFKNAIAKAGATRTSNAFLKAAQLAEAFYAD